jgi:hypothetical protein
MAEFDLNYGTVRSMHLTVGKPVADVQATTNPAVVIASPRRPHRAIGIFQGQSPKGAMLISAQV